MVKVDFAHVVQTAILDKRTNQLSLINIIHGFGTVVFPFIAPEFTFVLRTTRDIASTITLQGTPVTFAYVFQFYTYCM
jgi:hypothetical protein